MLQNNYNRKTASEALINSFNLTEEEKTQTTKTGTNSFFDRTGWAFTYLTKAGCIEITDKKAVYKITQRGMDLLKLSSDTKTKFDKVFLLNNSIEFREWKEGSFKTIEKLESESNQNNSENDDVEEFDIDAKIQEYNDEFDVELIERIRNLTWQEFEDFCAKLLEKMGYGVAARRNVRQRDDGIDGEIFEDELGLRGKIVIQAKKWKYGNNVGIKDIKEFLYKINKENKKGVFITTSDFTKDALEVVEKDSGAQIFLMNHKELLKLCKKYQHFCEKKTKEFFVNSGIW